MSHISSDKMDHLNDSSKCLHRMNRHSSSADRYHRHTHERRCVLDLTTVSGRLAPCLEESPTFSDSITETSSKQTLDIAAPERPVLNSRVNLPPHLAMPPGPPTSPVPSPPLATGFICQNLGGQLCQTQCQGLANHPTQLISIDGGQGHSSQSAASVNDMSMFDKYGTEGSNEVADTGRIPAHPCETVAHTTNTNEISAGQNCPIDLSSSLRLRLRRRRNAVCGNTALGQGLKDFLLSYVVSHLTESMSDSLSLTSPQRSQTLQQQQHSLLRHRLIQRHQQMLARRRQTSEVQSTCQSNSAPGVSAPICGTHGSVSTGPASFVSSIRVGSSDDLMHFETNRDNIKSVLEAGVGPSDEIYAELERERERESVDQSRFMPNFIRSSPTKMQTVFSPHMGLVTTDEGNSPEPSEEDEELDLNPTAEEEVEEQICRKNLSSIRLPFELDSDSAESADASIDS